MEEEKKLTIKKPRKFWLVFLILGIIGIVSGVTCFLVAILIPKEEKPGIVFPEISESSATEEYSLLTGEALADASLKNSPVYCIQIPNGLDGARPQVGLTEAGVVFEAIAEAGITRFAAIFQNPTQAVIGPIRSLRIYYLEWDTPFDCAIVHAGGAANALEAVRAGGYKDLTENYAYMYRGNAGNRLWNNLFTTSTELKQFAADTGFTTSNIQGFSRLTPKEAKKDWVDNLVANVLDITEPTSDDTSVMTPSVSAINLNFGYASDFNVHYDYDISTNTYKRSFRSGEAHNVYKCPDEDLGEVNPEGNCNLAQLSPKVVIAMVMDEKKAPDGYYESIATIGSGEVYVFQNGGVLHGIWKKPSRGEQIKFYDDSGTEIRLVPGQTFISAVPGYGSIEY